MGTPRDILAKLADVVRETWPTPRIRDLHGYYAIYKPPVMLLANARRVRDSNSVQWIGLSETAWHQAGMT